MQAYLMRIANYLKQQGAWWHYNEKTNDVIFHDGEEAPSFQPDGPIMRDFTSSSLKTALDDVENAWKYCLHHDIKLPIEKINLFDKDGEK